MPAYMIVTAQLKDRQAFVEGYAKVAAALITQFGGRYVVRAPGEVSLEGPWGEGSSVVISEWPDRAAAEAFWNSPEYQAAKTMREGIAECQVLLIEAPGLT